VLIGALTCTITRFPSFFIFFPYVFPRPQAQRAFEAAADERTARERRRERRADNQSPRKAKPQAEAEASSPYEQELLSMPPTERATFIKNSQYMNDAYDPPVHPSMSLEDRGTARTTYLNELDNDGVLPYRDARLFGLNKLTKAEYQKLNICSKTIVQNLCLNLYDKCPPVYSLITEGRFGCEVEVTHPVQPALKYRGRGSNAKVAEKRAAWEAIKHAATWATRPEQDPHVRPEKSMRVTGHDDDDADGVGADGARGGGMPVLPGPVPAALAARAGTIPTMDKETLLRVLRGYDFLSLVEYDVIGNRLENEEEYLRLLDKGSVPWYTLEAVAAHKEGSLDKLIEIDRLIKLRGDVPDSKFINMLMFTAMQDFQTERWYGNVDIVI